MSDRKETFVVATLRRSLGSFSFPDFRLYWTGSGLTIVTIRIQEVVLGWQVLEMTDSAFWLGLVAFAYGVPLLIFSPVTGLLADRFRRQNVVMGSMVLAAGVSLALAAMTLMGIVQPILIVLTSFGIGCAFSLFAPARLALLPHLVPGKQLFNASSLEYTTTRLMGFLGPLVAGYLLALAGSGPALLVQALLFLLSGFVFMKTGVAIGKPPVINRAGVWTGLKEAVAFLRSEPPLLALVLLGLFIVPFGMIYRRLTQVFVYDVLDAGPTLLGLALSLSGLGAATSGLVITMMKPIKRPGPVLLVAAALFGLALIGLSTVREQTPTLVVLFILGLSSGVYLTISHVIFQTSAPDALRGRVLSIWGMVWGLLPITALVGGSLADIWGVAVVFAVCGSICLVGCVVMGLTPSKLRQL